MFEVDGDEMLVVSERVGFGTKIDARFSVGFESSDVLIEIAAWFEANPHCGARDGFAILVSRIVLDRVSNHLGHQISLLGTP